MTSQLFDQILMEETKARAYHLTAIITYYGKHYSTFCYHGKHQEWVYLDDANVRKVSVTHNSYCFLIWGYYILNPTISSLLFVMWSQVGKKWSDVKELFKKGHYQPLLLLYTCPSATPIDASTALTTDIGECYHYCVALCCMAWEKVSRIICFKKILVCLLIYVKLVLLSWKLDILFLEDLYLLWAYYVH